MQIVCPTITIAEKFLGTNQKQDGEKYRLLSFIIQQPVADGLLLYNVLTRCLIHLDKEEMKHLTELDELVAKWFLVPISHDDRKLCHQLKSVARMFAPPSNNTINRFTILPTTDCNARCYYCYQKGRSRLRMTDEIAYKTADFIMRKSAGEKIKLNWFGGEPLYNLASIDIICNQLSQSGVDFESSMVSNGYLFDDELISRVSRDWHLQSVQVTIDGTKKIYNRTKAYIYQDENAYERVLYNIECLLRVGIKVDVRLNVTLKNMDDIEQLVEELGKRFQPSKLLRVYTHAIYDYHQGQTSMFEKTEDAQMQLLKRRVMLYDRLEELGFIRPSAIPNTLTLHKCMADNEHDVLITPDGKLGRCEQQTDDYLYGHIDSEEYNKAVYDSYLERLPESESCSTCPYYPDCIRLTMCANNMECTAANRKEHIIDMKRSMLYQYDLYQAKLNQ
jgi:radical SAM protein with 4Fe4S-binding SPASM domain